MREREIRGINNNYLLLGYLRTLDQAKSLLKFVEAISEKTLRSNLNLREGYVPDFLGFSVVRYSAAVTSVFM